MQTITANVNGSVLTANSPSTIPVEIGPMLTIVPPGTIMTFYYDLGTPSVPISDYDYDPVGDIPGYSPAPARKPFI